MHVPDIPKCQNEKKNKQKKLNARRLGWLAEASINKPSAVVRIQPSIQFWLISELSAMRNIHWFPIYVHLSRLTRLSKSRSLMAVTLDVSKRPICFVSRGPLCHWNESDYQLLNINSNLLIIGDRWFSSFNKSERVKIAHYLVRQ